MIIEQLSGIYFSDVLIMISVVALLVLVPGYIVHIRRDIPYKWFVHTFFTLSYLGIIGFITIFRRTAGTHSGKLALYLEFGFSHGYLYSKRQLVYCLLNVLLFVPWGFLIYRFMDRGRFIKSVILSTLVGFTTSVLVETVQLFTGTGVFELTDLLTNVTGTFVGAVICALFILCLERETKLNEKEE
jgi:glycopeptide antibiotics resistance protein